MIESLFHAVVSGERRGLVASGARGLLSLAASPYGWAVARRNAGFDSGRNVTSLGRPTVSVGNLTVGGTGKTPVVAWLCRRLLDAGVRPAVLSRGYKAAEGELADEQKLLASIVGDDLEMEADPSRILAAGRVLARRPNIGAFVLDDGFQHRRASRDVDLVLIDATRPFGHGHLLPRGLLREPVESLRRATAILITRCDLGDVAAVRRGLPQGVPIAESQFALDVSAVDGRPAVAACGIGNPAAFAEGLRRAGVVVRELMPFGDHHAFTAADALQIADATPDGGVAVVTGKDWVKLRDVWPTGAAVVVVGQTLSIAGGDDGLFSLILDGLRRSSQPQANQNVKPATVT